MTKVLIVDDDPTACRILRRMLKPEYETVTFQKSREAFQYFVEHRADLILTDLRMPEMDGIEFMSRAKKVHPEVIVFVITGYSSVDSAVAAIKLGAYDYIPKPFDPDDVLIRIQRATREKSLKAEVRCCRQEKRFCSHDERIVTRHPEMLSFIRTAKKVAVTDSTVLIQGETGVGKELVARMIHRLSPRRKQTFVPVNCSALSDGIMESELFGHEKGAFTGATGKRIGFFELVNHGTLLLDEIGTTSRKFQVMILRVLQDRSIYRVGSTSPIPIDTRVIASTNQDLEQEAHRNRFRSDLYYRLSVVTLKIPPLRARISDIPLLVDHFIQKYRGINPKITGITSEGIDLLSDYPYPGNVRELENIIERAMILETGPLLTPSSLLVGSPLPPKSVQDHSSPSERRFNIREAEKEHIKRVLQICDGRRMKAADMLGINKTTLWRKMKRYDLSPQTGLSEKNIMPSNDLSSPQPDNRLPSES